jgi:Tfp pilus assembly protein PilN
MAALKKSNQINLIPKDKFTESLLGRTLGWLMTTFRIVVIIVEMVVVVAFLSRFWLDAKNADLNDEMKAKTSQIQAMAKTEQEINNVQQRLSIFSAMTSTDISHAEDIKTIASFSPNNVFLSNITFSPNLVNLKGASPSEKSIAQFIVNLSSVEKYQSVMLTQVDADKKYEGLLEFSLTIETTK